MIPQSPGMFPFRANVYLLIEVLSPVRDSVSNCNVFLYDYVMFKGIITVGSRSLLRDDD